MNTKKIVSMILAIALVLTLFPVNALAVTGEKPTLTVDTTAITDGTASDSTEEDDPYLWTKVLPADTVFAVDQTFYVPVKLTGMAKLNTVQLEVVYNDLVLDLVSLNTGWGSGRSAYGHTILSSGFTVVPNPDENKITASNGTGTDLPGNYHDYLVFLGFKVIAKSPTGSETISLRTLVNNAPGVNAADSNIADADITYVSGTVSVEKAPSGEEGGESGGTTTDSGYEIWYELDETAPDTENNNVGDNYKEYDISTDAGKKVTATLYIKNKGTAPVSLQAYDIYLTYDSNLTPGTFTPTNDSKGVAKTDADGKFHLQAIGSNTETADININLPETGAEGNTVELGKLTFTIGANAIHNTAMPITLADNSVNKSANSTNIGYANYEFEADGTTIKTKEDGTKVTTGNKNAAYPSVGGTTEGAEVMTTYDVIFETKGGTNVETQKVGHNLTAKEPANPTMDNHSFAGWYTTDTYETEFDFSTKITTNTKVYAKWTPNTFTVKWYNADNTTVLETDTPVALNETPSFDGTNPSKTDSTGRYTYEFKGWATTPNATVDEIVTLATYKVTDNTDFYPVFSSTENTFTVIWKNYDDSELHTDEQVAWNTVPNYDGTITPSKSDSTNGQYSYEFLGWNTEKTAEEALVTLPNVTANVTYYAIYKQNTKSYTVEYKAGDGTFEEGATTEVDVEFGKTPETIPTPTAPAGYYFSGWSDGKTTYKTDLSDFTVSGEVTLTAQYTAEKYTIIFDLNGGTGKKPDDIGAEYDKDVIMPKDDDFSNTGYAFGGWSVNKTVTEGETIYGGGNTYKNLPYDANKQITLYARWTEDPHKITVTSPDNGKVEADKLTAKEGDKITLTATPNAGYVFSSWQVKDADGVTVTVDADNTFTMPDSDVTVTAIFVKVDLAVAVIDPEHGHVTAKKNDTEISSAQIGDTITLTSSFDDGYELDKYIVTYKVKNAEGVEETKPVEMNEDGTSFNMPGYPVTVTASYKTTNYTITLDPNGGANSAEGWATADGKYTKTYHIESETIILPTEENMSKTGYTFAGWYESAAPAEGEQSVSQVDKGSTGNKTYYAKWKADEVNYTVNYWLQNIGGGAELNSDNFTKQDDDTATRKATADSVISVVPEKDYTGFTTPDAQANVTIKPDGTTVVDFYYTRNIYTITFKDGETTLSDLTITKQYGDSVDAPAGPTKNGYTFKAWDPAVPSTMPAVNTTISATWDLVTYNITYIDGDKVLTGLSPATYTIESKDKLPSYSKTNYIFNGWKVTSGANEKWAENAVINAGSGVESRYGHVTLTADWDEAITYVVEDYKYAADGYKMLRIPYKQTETNGSLEYKFNTVSMYYMPATVSEKYLLNTSDTGVFYYLIESEYVGTDNKLTAAGMALISTGTVTDRATITYDGKINDDTIVNIADANIVYQMIVNSGGYYTGANDLTIEQRLRADMHKEAADASVKRATIDDVHKIMGIINGTN